ncbi:UNVERIFIED_CONTAM: hypothetical protein HDU68_003275 [Siphonaria sp. JEL0065]|nr:hypothetical protein HDU68_003275 [Siphonaria sp. JEL0065]
MSTTTTTYLNLRTLHAISMLLAFTVLPLPALFIARYSKESIPNWLAYHLSIMILSFLSSLLGLLFIELSIPTGAQSAFWEVDIQAPPPTFTQSSGLVPDLKAALAPLVEAGLVDQTDVDQVNNLSDFQDCVDTARYNDPGHAIADQLDHAGVELDGMGLYDTYKNKDQTNVCKNLLAGAMGLDPAVEVETSMVNTVEPQPQQHQDQDHDNIIGA